MHFGHFRAQLSARFVNPSLGISDARFYSITKIHLTNNDEPHSNHAIKIALG